MNNNTCKYCGKGLNDNYKSKMYCSQECGYKYRYRKKNNITVKQCGYCDAEFRPNENGAKYKYCSDECFNEYRREYNRLKMREVNPPKHDVNKVCEWCGVDFVVPPRTAHQARFCNDKCRETWWSREVYGHKPIEEHNEERREQKLIRQERLKKERVIRTSRRTLAYAIRLVREDKEEQQRIKELTRYCEECGKTFYNPLPHALTCSDKCRRRRGNRVSRMHRNNRYNERNLIDKDITLSKLYERDKGLCYICKEPCDYEDITITDEGHYIVGRTYPSIDHVIPISKQGTHSWGNVKLCHHYCNTIKRDNLMDNERDKALV